MAILLYSGSLQQLTVSSSCGPQKREWTPQRRGGRGRSCCLRHLSNLEFAKLSAVYSEPFSEQGFMLCRSSHHPAWGSFFPILVQACCTLRPVSLQIGELVEVQAYQLTGSFIAHSINHEMDAFTRVWARRGPWLVMRAWPATVAMPSPPTRSSGCTNSQTFFF